jgi:tyrosinase
LAIIQFNIMVIIHSFLALGAAIALPSLSVASPLKHAGGSVVSRQNDVFVIEGVKEGGVQPRLNIRDLERKPENKEMWTLFLLALQRLQKTDQTTKASFYSIAGTVNISPPVNSLAFIHAIFKSV